MKTIGTTPRQRAGLLIAGILCLLNVVSIASPTPDGEVGPPLEVLLIGAVIGVVGLIAAILAWRGGDRRLLRVVAACLILMVIGSLPAFFVAAVPAGIKVLVAANVLVTLAATVLILSRRRPAPVPEAVASSRVAS